MTPIVDNNFFCSRYVSKKEKVVPLEVAKKIEAEMYEVSAKYRLLLSEVQNANIILDEMGIPRNQRNNSLPLSLIGRIRAVQSKKSISGVCKCGEELYIETADGESFITYR